MKKRPAPFSGLLLIDKPQGMTSHDVVARVRRILSTREVGHAGTLDPMATGLLICLVGKATKLSQWISAETKAYEGAVSLGAKTDTGDAEGEITKRFQKESANEQEIVEVFESLLGEQLLSVPKFSAIKVKGEKLYQKAFKGEDFEPPKRPMFFFGSKVLGIEGNKILFFVKCSKGTYIRSWAEEVGARLQTGAHLSMLRRQTSGDFSLGDAISLEELEEKKEKPLELLKTKSFVPLESIFKKAPILRLNTKEEKLFNHGQLPHSLVARLNPLIREAQKKSTPSMVKIFDSAGELRSYIHLNEEGRVKVQRFLT